MKRMAFWSAWSVTRLSFWIACLAAIILCWFLLILSAAEPTTIVIVVCRVKWIDYDQTRHYLRMPVRAYHSDDEAWKHALAQNRAKDPWTNHCDVTAVLLEPK